MSKLFVVGIGPGGLNHMTFEAHQAIEKADVVVGYQTYLEFIEPLLVYLYNSIIHCQNTVISQPTDDRF